MINPNPLNSVPSKAARIVIVPAIDLIEGKCVRLTQGDYLQKKIYNHDPLELAKYYEDSGITRLHLVDLDGAAQQHIVNWRILEKIATQTQLILDFGGGLKSDADLKIAFESGASMITGGSIAVKDRAMFLKWLLTYGPDKIILGADTKDGKIAVNGWKERSEWTLEQLITSYIDDGIHQVISTDIARDGMLTGPNIEQYQTLQTRFPSLEVIASGGISCLEDIIKLNAIGVPQVIVGKALYEHKITLQDIADFYA